MFILHNFKADENLAYNVDKYYSITSTEQSLANESFEILVIELIKINHEICQLRTLF